MTTAQYVIDYTLWKQSCISGKISGTLHSVILKEPMSKIRISSWNWTSVQEYSYRIWCDMRKTTIALWGVYMKKCCGNQSVNDFLLRWLNRFQFHKFYSANDCYINLNVYFTDSYTTTKVRTTFPLTNHFAHGWGSQNVCRGTIHEVITHGRISRQQLWLLGTIGLFQKLMAPP